VWPLKFNSRARCSRVFSGAETLPRGWLAPLSEGARDSPVHTGQSGAPRIATLISFYFDFLNRFLSNL
jgi:hypothetical protein